MTPEQRAETRRCIVAMTAVNPGIEFAAVLVGSATPRLVRPLSRRHLTWQGTESRNRMDEDKSLTMDVFIDFLPN